MEIRSTWPRVEGTPRHPAWLQPTSFSDQQHSVQDSWNPYTEASAKRYEISFSQHDKVERLSLLHPPCGLGTLQRAVRLQLLGARPLVPASHMLKASA